MSIPMTKKGYEALKVELTRLKKEDRPKNVQAIAEAREHGDLKENAEYFYAKEEQQHIATRIKQIENTLADAQVIEINNGPCEKVVFGTTVRLVEVKTKEEKMYILVGQEEANIKNGSISVQSPIGRALIGHQAGDTVQVTRPAGMIEYEIREIFIQDF